ncbi:hypothetical protein ACH5RR_008192 [Cinchona calisaya]|uniref:Uncharacterized protein n=1 Tax=Cinchona calisaya TaxID=153742 RepID=A0ABD3AEI4_9GENT
MASCIPPASTTHHHHRHSHRHAWPNSTAFYPPFFTSLAPLHNHTRIYSSIYHLRRSFPLSTSNSRRWFAGRCRASSPGPPSPPKLDPTPGDNPPPSSGVLSSFSRVQDTVRIFFAVLFWMSLFFWYCVWDGRNDGGPKHGSRFRR